MKVFDEISDTTFDFPDDATPEEISDVLYNLASPSIEKKGIIGTAVQHLGVGWEQSKDERVGQFSQWKTQYKAPVASEKLEVTKESPIDLLRRLVEEEEEHTEKVRFILAVMLERQKVLVEKDTQAVPSVQDWRQVVCRSRSNGGMS